MEAKLKNRYGSSSQGTYKNALHLMTAFLVLSAFIYGGFQAFHSSLFLLTHLMVKPISEDYPLPEAQVLALSKVPLDRVNLFDLHLEPIELRLMKNPWVKGVVLGKQFPHTLSIQIIERNPVALLSEEKGKVLYLESDGSVFEDQAMVYVKDLPMMSGFSTADREQLKKVNEFIAHWFESGKIPGLKLSSINYSEKQGLRAVVLYPMKNKEWMRTVLELGFNLEEASLIPQERLKKVLTYLADKSMQASKIWLGDGKKIVVKVSRGS